MKPFSLQEVLQIASDPMGFLTAPLPLHRQPERMSEVAYHHRLGIEQVQGGQTVPDVTDAEAEGCDYLEAYLAGFRGEMERRAA